MKPILLIIITFFSFYGSSQFVLYDTYEDYRSNNGKGYVGDIIKFKEDKVVLVDNGKKISYDLGDYWGFKYKGELFRMDKYLLRVVIDGEFCYYENGMAYMYHLVNNLSPDFYETTRRCFISKDLNSRTILMIKKGPILEDKAELEQFKIENPQFSSYFECIESADVNVYYYGGPTKICAQEFMENNSDD